MPSPFPEADQLLGRVQGNFHLSFLAYDLFFLAGIPFTSEN